MGWSIKYSIYSSFKFPASLTDDLSDIERRFNNSSPDQPMALHLATVRMRELEQLVEDLRSDKRRAVDDFALEKVIFTCDKHHSLILRYYNV